MIWRIEHHTRYRYDAPVFLEPHVLRLTPATDASQRLLSSTLQVEPSQAGLVANLDIESNTTRTLWFEDLTDHLDIILTSTVETLRTDPFDYVWLGERQLPLAYLEEITAVLAPYRAGAASDAVEGFVASMAGEKDLDAQTFPAALARAIHRSCQQIFREYGEPLPAEQTLRQGAGSCRDLTELFLQAARSQGFAARFVSGYLGADVENAHELHAWAEVYMPGGGWRGFDPSAGLAVADQHVAVARAASSRLAAPVTGSFRGSATASLITEVAVSNETTTTPAGRRGRR